MADLRVSAKLEQEFESQVLRIGIDRLKTWHAPGILFLGDAAHTMTPAGGQGLNLAIRDSIVAANHILDVVRAGAPIDAEVFRRKDRFRAAAPRGVGSVLPTTRSGAGAP